MLEKDRAMLEGAIPLAERNIVEDLESVDSAY